MERNALRQVTRRGIARVVATVVSATALARLERVELALALGPGRGRGHGPDDSPGGAGTRERRRKRRCEPACAAGQRCRRGACTCEDGGTACGVQCCRIGQACANGSCSDPEPECVPAGGSCKGVGLGCCAGLACASGQGGQDDVACYVSAGGACATSADCVFAATCTGGVCIAAPQPTPTAPPPTPTPTVCTPTIPVSGNPVDDGAALFDALLAAEGGQNVVITLASGTYHLPQRENELNVVWTSGSVTVQGCEDAEVTLAPAEAGPPSILLFDVRGGALTLRNLNLAGPGDTGIWTSHPASPTQIILDQVTLAGFDYGISAFGSNARITIAGGSYAAKYRAIQNGGAVWSCSNDPQLTSTTFGSAVCGGGFPPLAPTACGCQAPG